MGTVYLAEDTRSVQLVALKLLPPEYINDLGLRASFDREAQLIAALEHESIVPVFEFGEQGGQPFIAMQFMPNGSLADRLLRGPLAAIAAAQILERLSGAIDYAHTVGVIHRDLKPSNILFDEQDQAYLADFGIAWQTTATRQPGLLVSGTPAYLSPEQALGEQVIDGRSDIYALGIILFEMLTGRLPFDGQTPLAIILQHRYDPPPSLRTVDWNLPANLDKVIQRALAKDPEQRFSTAREFSDAYRKALEFPPGTASQDESPILEAADERERQQGASLAVAERVSPELKDAVRASFPPKRGLPSSAQAGPANAALPATKGTVRWRGLHLLSLGSVTLLGVLLAAGLVAFLRAGSAKFSSGIHVDYDGASFTITNRYNTPIDLSGAVFQRISGDGSVTATFLGSHWQQLAGSAPQLLQPGACFQVLQSNPAASRLSPGEALPKPGGCRSLQAWLVVLDPGSSFWVPEGDSTSFQVILDGSPVKTCLIAVHSCDFSVPLP